MTMIPWSRRRFIANTIGSAAALQLSTAASVLRLDAAEPSCTLIQEQEEGPYYIDREILRKDITEGHVGVPLTLRLALIDVNRCTPLTNAALDIWHCDALGIYSGYTAFSSGGPGGPNGPGPGGPPPGGPGAPPDFGPGGPPTGGPQKRAPTDKQAFLRGVQLTDANGIVEFTTVYPGCYAGRVNHIHLKVHIAGHSEGREYRGGHLAHTGQIFFPEEISKAVVALKPYSTHNIERTTLEDDFVFTGEHGSQSIAQLTALNRRSAADGYVATLTLGVDPSKTPGPSNPFGPPRGK
jgi:protocatechuate 3,4-dioxygenase beta subunit